MLGRENTWYIRLVIFWGKQPEVRMRRSRRQLRRLKRNGMMLKENILIGSYYSYMQYAYFFVLSYHSELLSSLNESEGKCAAGKVGGMFTPRD